MRKSYVFIFICFVVAGYFVMAGGSPKTDSAVGDRFTGGAEAGEDADGRAAYEWNMLHDPATGRIPFGIRQRELAFVAGLPNDGQLINGRATASSLSFQARGPWNVGGRTRALGIDISNPNNIVAGTPSGGMWRSTDFGASWHSTTPANNYQSVSCLAQDTRRGHTNVWYYGTGEVYGASASATGAYYLGNGVYKSTDSGETWTLLPSTSVTSVTSLSSWTQLLWNVVTDPSDTVHDVVYAASYGAIYRSADAGTTWTPVLGAFGTSYFTDVAVSKSGVVYATLSSDGTHRGIYRSPDGVTFTNITPTGFPINYNRLKIGISPSNEEQVYLLGNTPGFGAADTNYLGTVEWNSLWRYTYVSGDGSGAGGMWSDRSPYMPMNWGVFNKFTSQGSYDLVVKVKPDDTNTVFIGGTNIYRSTSAFRDTTHSAYIGGYVQGASLPVVLSYANHHPDQHELCFFPGNPNKMLSGNDGGVFVTNDNTAANVGWTSLDNGYISSMFYSCAIDHATNSDILIGGAQDNGSWYTNNTTLSTPWVTPRGGDGSFCAIADNEAAYYFSIQNGRMMRAKLNASGGVDSFARIDPIGGFGYQFVNPYTLDPNNNNLMYLAAGSHLWRNDNLSGIPYAGNWDSISTNWVRFPDSVVGGYALTAVTACKTPANRVYFGTNYGTVYKVDGANVGTPTKVNITSTTAYSVFPGGANVTCIAADPSNGDNLIVAFSNYGVYSLFYSTDAGASWSKIGGNLEGNASGAGDGPSVRWVTICPVTDGMVYLVGTSAGLFGTTQLNGLNTKWTQLGTNTIGSNIVNMIDYRASDGLVVVATHGHGMFSSHITHVTDVDAVANVSSSKSSLELNCYPNPFFGNEHIGFNMLEGGEAKVTITNMAGQTVGTVLTGRLDPGHHEVPFNSGALPAGTYFCTLTTAGGSETKQIVLVR